jgi:hypothetical protein
MKRLTSRTPGYDCRNAPCQHEEKGDHGISGGYWRFVVVADEGDLALVLTVFADDYPDTVPAAVRKRWRDDRARDLLTSLDVCSLFPTDRDDVGHSGRPCEWLGVPCFRGWSSSLQGAELLKASGHPYQAEPTEALWLALEEKLTRLAPQIRADDASKAWARCPTCGGTDHLGFVKVP